MYNSKLEVNAETKSQLVRKSMEPQTVGFDPKRIFSPQQGSMVKMKYRIGNTAPARVHGDLLSCAIGGTQSRRAHYLLRLQRLYGNCYVQRLLAMTRRTDGETGIARSEDILSTREEEEEEVTARMQSESAAVQRDSSPEFTLGTPGDIYEQEAEKIATEVAENASASDVSIGEFNLDHTLQHLASDQEGSRLLGSLKIHQQNIHHTDNRSSVGLRILKANRGSDQGKSTVSAPLSLRIQKSKGRGSALPSSIQRTMEAQIGHEFGNVRVKTDAEAADLCQRLGARAFTHGSDIWLGHGESVNDVRLMAHELTHVVQQGAARRISSQRMLERATSNSGLLGHIQSLLKTGPHGAALFRQEILQFQRDNSAEKLAMLKKQILESPTAETIRHQDNISAVRLAACGGGGSVTPTFPTMTTIAADSTVESERAADWSAGLGDFLERAGWIMWENTSGTYSVVNKVTGTEDGVNPGATPPDSATTYCVGHYHQHPPIRTGRPGTFPVGPSAADIAFANGRNNPGVVRDFTDTSRTTVTNYPYGPARRS